MLRNGANMVLAFGGSPQDLIIVFVVALIFLGPKKLPEVGRQIGQALREFRKVADDVTGVAHSVKADVESAIRPVTAAPAIDQRPTETKVAEPVAASSAPQGVFEVRDPQAQHAPVDGSAESHDLMAPDDRITGIAALKKG